MSGLAILAALAVGFAGGLAHFALLARNAALYLRPRGLWPAIGLQLARLALTGALLVGAARFGAMPLLAAALGLFLARPVAIRLAVRRASQ